MAEAEPPKPVLRHTIQSTPWFISAGMSPIGPLPMTEHIRLARSNRLMAEDFSKRSRYDFIEYPPLFLQGALTNPATLVQVCNRPYSGIEMARKMVPATLKGVKVGWSEQLEGVGNEETAGFVVFGRSKHDRVAIDMFHPEGWKRVKALVEVVLGDGVMREICAIMWMQAHDARTEASDVEQ